MAERESVPGAVMDSPMLSQCAAVKTANNVVSLYRSTVQHYLESRAWVLEPYLKKDPARLKKLHGRTTKMTVSLWKTSVWAFTVLEQRQKRDVMEVYKITHGVEKQTELFPSS